MVVKEMYWLVAVVLCLTIPCNCQLLSVSTGGTPITNNQIVPVEEGQNFQFRCVTTDPGAVITLTITPTLSVQIGGSSSDRLFTVNNVQRTILSSTQFSCTDDAMMISFSIDVQFEPEYNFSRQSYQTKEDETFSITASVASNPEVSQADTVWSRENMILSGVDQFELNGTTLKIESVNRADAGTYTITGNNTVGTGSASFNLTVFFGPDFVNNSGPLMLNAGDRLVIDCSVTESGSNPEVISITLNGTSLTTRPVLSDPKYTVIDAVTEEFNGRSYTCIANNGETEQQITYIISVNVQGSSANTETSTTTTSTSTSSMSTTVRSTNSGGLSTEAIGGIIAGVIIFVLIIAVVIVVGIVVCLMIIKRGTDKRA